MTSKQWFAVDAIVPSNAANAAEEALAMVADLGTSRDGLKKKAKEPVCITGFFSELPELDSIRGHLNTILEIYGLHSDTELSSRAVEDADWLAEWKRHWQPVEIGRFIVSPPWLEPEPHERLLIRIEPNMAFGTGTHETTQLCLEAISEIYTPGQSMLDVGTGTGILAIAAAKLGSTQIVACDTDADSVKIARDNAELNAVGGRIEFFEGSIETETLPADLVAANLTIDVILPMLSLLLAKTTRYLLLSGILAEQETLITAALSEAPNAAFEIRRKGEWIAVIVSFPAS